MDLHLFSRIFVAAGFDVATFLALMLNILIVMDCCSRALQCAIVEIKKLRSPASVYAALAK